jgi:hypothetical protein
VTIQKEAESKSISRFFTKQSSTDKSPTKLESETKPSEKQSEDEVSGKKRTATEAVQVKSPAAKKAKTVSSGGLHKYFSKKSE